MEYDKHSYDKRSSGLDFSDSSSTLNAHPDLVLNASAPSLQRNKTERNRLQGLMRLPTMRGMSTSAPTTDKKKLSLKERWNLWMVNEGGRRIFFYAVCFLHVLVFIFGWYHYANKDNLVTARATFGITYGALLPLAMEN